MTYLQFSEATQQPSAERFGLAILLAQTKFHCEPVACGQLFDVVIGCAKTGQANLLGKSSEAWIYKEMTL